MQATKAILLIVLSFFVVTSYAATTPTAQKDPTPIVKAISQIKAKDVEKYTGKKLTFLQKLQLRFVQNRLVKRYLKTGDDEMTEKQKKQANASLILGISSIVLLLIPYVGLLALPAGILAIIFGTKSLKGNSNAKGIVGIVTGGVTILLFLIALALLAAFLGGL